MSVKTKGIINLGGTCYLNSILQIVYHLKELREYIKEIDISLLTNELDQNLITSMKNFIILYENDDKKPINLNNHNIYTNINNILSNDDLGFRIGAQDDPTIFFLKLNDILKSINNKTYLNKITFKSINTSTCKNSNYSIIEKKDDILLKLTIPIQSFKSDISMHDVISNYMSETIIDYKNDLVDNECKKHNNNERDYYHKKENLIKILPFQKYLFIYIAGKGNSFPYSCKDITENIMITKDELFKEFENRQPKNISEKEDDYIRRILELKQNELINKYRDKHIISDVKPPFYYIIISDIMDKQYHKYKYMINDTGLYLYKNNITDVDNITVDNIHFKLLMCSENNMSINGKNFGGHYIFSYFTKPFIQISDSSVSFNDNKQNSHLKNGVLYVYERIDYVPDKLEQSMKELQEQVKDDPILKSYQDYLIKEHEKFMKS
jgi:hypothetical protein